MDSCSDDEEPQFFDANDNIVVASNLDSNCPEKCASDWENFEISSWVSRNSQFDVWVQNPESVQERRSKFFKWMGLPNVNKISGSETVDSSDSDGNVDRITWSSGAVLGSSGFVDEFLLSRSAVSICSRDDSKSSRELCSTEDFVCRIGNLDGGASCVGVELSEEGRVGVNKQIGSDGSLLVEQLEHSFGSSLLSLEGKNSDSDSVQLVGRTKRVKKWWLNKLRSFSCVMERSGESRDSDLVLRARTQRVKVCQCSKKSKELSALYLGQDILAHEGSILTMKFSPDGKYFASAGEDGILRVWEVVEEERVNKFDIADMDPSRMYFTLNHHSKLNTLHKEKEKMGRSRGLRKTSDSACVIIPPRVFRILEKPLHEFQGHKGEILDISWSKNNHLLSSSVDNTVRLWRVGCNQCLKVFLHSNYVTCVHFNTVDDNYFISGSIDGKVRIWEISGCQVVNWTDIKDIVTAVCYRPDGQGAIVGSLTGYCRFYNIADDQLQLEAQICLHSKKKSSCKRVTGFQYLPQDPSKVMVTCADSRIRILQGTNVISKYKGISSAGNFLSASLTCDGKHIVSACEDSNVYIWDCVDQSDEDRSQSKKVKSSERFPTNASVAIPWCGFQNRNGRSGWQFGALTLRTSIVHPFSSPACFSHSQELFLEAYPKGSATWPEEKLPASNQLGLTSSMHKSEYKFLRSSCHSTSSSHAWGLVIVTAGWDGRIRSFHNYGLPIR
ncbi:hypothetical protein Ancab_010003 [Ancistrocladus abbreviatus]